MKKNILFILLIAVFNINAQESKNNIYKHEIKINSFILNGFQPLHSYNVSYEKNIGKKNTLGLEIMYTKIGGENFSSTFIYKEYYNRNHKGLFGTLFLMFLNKKASNPNKKTKNNLYIGSDIGYEFLMKKRFTISLFFGFGIKLPALFENGFGFTKRTGISFGYRF